MLHGKEWHCLVRLHARRILQSAEQMSHQFDTLSFAAAEGGARLAELDVTQARVTQRLEGADHFRNASEKLDRFLYGKLQHLGDVFSGVMDVECFAVEPRATTGLATHKRRR